MTLLPVERCAERQRRAIASSYQPAARDFRCVDVTIIGSKARTLVSVGRRMGQPRLSLAQSPCVGQGRGQFRAWWPSLHRSAATAGEPKFGKTAQALRLRFIGDYAVSVADCEQRRRRQYAKRDQDTTDSCPRNRQIPSHCQRSHRQDKSMLNLDRRHLKRCPIVRRARRTRSALARSGAMPRSTGNAGANL
jgi:hypothetical protein